MIWNRRSARRIGSFLLTRRCQQGSVTPVPGGRKAALASENNVHPASTRIITAEVNRLVVFYEMVTGLTATRYTPDFAKIRTPGATLAIGGTRKVALFGGDAVAEAAANRSSIIEFRVGDVDAEHARLASGIEVEVVQPPTMPWGNRSLLLRDPDGTLGNLFALMTGEAKQRLDQR
ncbi:VOC family protein [Methylobacterium sp. Leaf111]|uniref:VOC family protein n=1 Tax=Methylobacterium sp. Leaf111 TaxID=1736257 RepID=UPI0032994BF5